MIQHRTWMYHTRIHRTRMHCTRMHRTWMHRTRMHRTSRSRMSQIPPIIDLFSLMSPQIALYHPPFSLCFVFCVYDRHNRDVGPLCVLPVTNPSSAPTCFTTSVTCSINDITAVGSLGNNCIVGREEEGAELAFVFIAPADPEQAPCDAPPPI